MSYIYIQNRYYSEYSVEALVDALEESDKLRALEEMARDVPWSNRSPEFQERLEWQREKAGHRAETALFLLGEHFLEHIQQGIIENMEEK